MDWKSEKGKALLWMAYPKRFVGTRGVLTIGGWVCVDGGYAPSWDRPEPVGSVTDAYHRGDLLPDPSDFLTYTALLAEFAQAERGDRHLKAPTGYAWTTEVDPQDKSVYWILYVYSQKLKQHGHPYDVDCDDPVEALVRARIILRGKE
jgi:hypothetical protein